METSLWTLTELAAEVATQLARNYEAADNGQVRAIPDERGIRYYTTLGLLDRPAAMRGRTALYGPRHLAQVVAIKRMQASGRSLAEIKPLLATIDDGTLSRVAGVVVPKAPKRAFWREAAEADDAAATTTTSANAPTATTPTTTTITTAPAPPAPPAGVATTVKLAVVLDAVTVLVDRDLDDDDLAALQRAAAPLLAELRRRGLIESKEPPPTVAQ